MASIGSDDGGGGESSLTPVERDVLTELRKILSTLNAINDTILKTIAATAEDGDVRKRQREAVETGKEVFGGVLGERGE